jgi:hypothetical protein
MQLVCRYAPDADAATADAEEAAAEEAAAARAARQAGGSARVAERRRQGLITCSHNRPRV